MAAAAAHLRSLGRVLTCRCCTARGRSLREGASHAPQICVLHLPRPMTASVPRPYTLLFSPRLRCRAHRISLLLARCIGGAETALVMAASCSEAR
jgi:hypothetical protein